MNRTAAIHRQTKETDIEVTLNLDGQGRCEVDTGVGFLDHMLNALATHALFDLTLVARGDLHIDTHHTIEDVALTLGQALNEALGDRHGIVRMGYSYVPMDEALARVVVDLSGRPYTVFDASWHDSRIGAFPTTLMSHFFESLAVQGRFNLHAAVLYGRDDHHQAEALFKGLARSLAQAVTLDKRRVGIPSTKGTLT